MLRFIIIFLFSLSLEAIEQHDVNFVKAVYIEKISRFLTWPEQKEKSAEFNLCVTGNSSVERHLSRLYKNRTIKKKPVNVIRINNADDAHKCHVLYVGNNNIDNFKSLKKVSVVLIGNDIDLKHKEAHINFFDEAKRVRFWISSSAYKDSNIQVNHLLLSIAKIAK